MITVDNLTFSYPGSNKRALSDVDLKITQGSLFGLLGPNGAGKTTLLSLFCGLLRSPVGALRIGASDIAGSRNTAQAAIGLVPQNLAFYPSLSIAENLLFFARIQRVSPVDVTGRIAEVSAVTGLEERMRVRGDRLSGGLKRRLNIAIGLLSKPQLLLLDEPTVGIDPQSRHFILDAIRTINRQGTTVIYTSHYMEEVEYLCDDIAIIDAGRVLVQGSLKDLLHSGDKTRLIVEANESLSETQRIALRDVFDINEQDRTLTIRVDLARDVPLALAALEKNQVAINRMYYGARNLEEVFLNYTNRTLRD